MTEPKDVMAWVKEQRAKAPELEARVEVELAAMDAESDAMEYLIRCPKCVRLLVVPGATLINPAYATTPEHAVADHVNAAWKGRPWTCIGSGEPARVEGYREPQPAANPSVQPGKEP